MDEIEIAKKELRNKIKNILSVPNEEQTDEVLSKLTDMVGNIKPKKVFSYVEHNHEIPVSKLFNYFFSLNVKLFAPYLNNNLWLIAPVVKNQIWIENRYKIKQAKNPANLFSTLNELDFNENDIVIVPGLAFSKDRTRLGYGGGTYDRFLTSTKVVKIGLCVEHQILSTIPQNERDIKMDKVITELTIY